MNNRYHRIELKQENIPTAPVDLHRLIYLLRKQHRTRLLLTINPIGSFKAVALAYSGNYGFYFLRGLNHIGEQPGVLVN